MDKSPKKGEFWMYKKGNYWTIEYISDVKEGITLVEIYDSL